MDTHKGAPPTLCLPGLEAHSCKALRCRRQALPASRLCSELRMYHSVLDVRAVNADRKIIYVCDVMRCWLALTSTCRSSGPDRDSAEVLLR